MTEEEKNAVRLLRERGYGYKTISNITQRALWTQLWQTTAVECPSYQAGMSIMRLFVPSPRKKEPPK